MNATADFSRAAEADALILCVPTPLNQYREPDLSFIRSTMESLVPHLRPGKVLSLESTTSRCYRQAFLHLQRVITWMPNSSEIHATL